MAFHKSNYGSFGDTLPCDLDGYVPQPGDRPENFCWPAGYEWDDDSWADFLAEVSAEIEEADQALDQWRNSNF